MSAGRDDATIARETFVTRLAGGNHDIALVTRSSRSSISSIEAFNRDVPAANAPTGFIALFDQKHRDKELELVRELGKHRSAR